MSTGPTRNRSAGNRPWWAGAVAVVLLGAGWAFSQETRVAEAPAFRTGAAEAPPVGTAGVRRLPEGAYGEQPIGVPYRRVFREDGTPYINVLRDIEPRPTLRTESAEVRFNLDLPDFFGNFPLLDRGTAPQDADLKLGPLYFNIRALSAGFLFSDNVNFNEDRESGAIAFTRLTGTALLQLTETFQLRIAGSLVYLPFENELGFNSSGFGRFYSLGLDAAPSINIGASYTFILGGWPVVFSDVFRSGIGRFTYGSRDDFDLFDGSRFDEVDRAGRYSFGGFGGGGDSRDGDRRDFAQEREFLYFTNTASLSTERLLPGEIRLRARIFRQDLFYNQGRRGLPGLREGASLFLAAERENLRFKPFFSYLTSRNGRDEAFDHQIRSGFFGPITPQLDIYASSGVFIDGSDGSASFVGSVELDHIAGPYTRESLRIGQRVGTFNEELTTFISYNLRQVLGPRTTGEFFALAARSEDLEVSDDDDEDFGRTEFRLGIRVNSLLGPKTRLRLGVTYANVSFAERGDSETLTGRAELAYRFTDSITSRLLYQHQRREDARRSTYENLVFLSLTKYFD